MSARRTLHWVRLDQDAYHATTVDHVGTGPRYTVTRQRFGGVPAAWHLTRHEGVHTTHVRKPMFVADTLFETFQTADADLQKRS